VTGLTRRIEIRADAAALAGEADGEDFLLSGPLGVTLYPGRLAVLASAL
jgi:hypothetical protein